MTWTMENVRIIMKRFEQRIRMIEEGYYSNDSAEESRKLTCIDAFRHPFFPDDVQAILAADGVKPESIWVRLSSYVGNTNGVEAFTGTLLNAPFDSNYNLSCGDAVFVAVVNGNDGKMDSFEKTAEFATFMHIVNESEKEETDTSGTSINSTYHSEDYNDDVEDVLNDAGLDLFDLELMDDDERAEVLEDAGLDPDDFDF